MRCRLAFYYAEQFRQFFLTQYKNENKKSARAVELRLMAESLKRGSKGWL